METVGLGFYFEDLPVGRKFKTVGRTITEVDIVNFVNCVGLTEVMFTDLEYVARDAAVNVRFAPASLAYAISEGLLVQATMQHTALAFLHMDLNVHKPTLAGDTREARTPVPRVSVRITSCSPRIPCLPAP